MVPPPSPLGRVLCGLVSLMLLCRQGVRGATASLSWARNVNNQGTTTVTAGDTVKWTVTDATSHTVTSDDGGFSSSSTLSGLGSSFSVVFPFVGSYSYHCSIHNMMKGTILVQAAPTSGPTSNPSFHPSAAPSTHPTSELVGPTTSPTISSSPTESPTKLPSSSPSITPSSPTFSPTSAPTIESFEYVPLTYPEVVSSGLATAATWSATLEVKEHRPANSRVSFNTRSYCYNGSCSYPGPTILLKPGDSFSLTVINRLGPESSGTTHRHNAIHSPNTTNVHTHGLHIDPAIDNVFVAIGPGDSYLYQYKIPSTHAPGLHWYHAHHHGSSTLQIMGGLFGAIVVEDGPVGPSELPSSILNADAHILVMSRMVFEQEVISGNVSQGCGPSFACDPVSQAPLCSGNEESSPWNMFREYSYPELAAAAGSSMLIDDQFVGTWGDRDFVFINGLYRPTIELNASSPSILRIVHAHGAGPFILRILNDPEAYCSMTILAWDGVYLDERLSLKSNETLNVVAAGRVDVEVLCTAPGLYKIAEAGKTILWLRVNETGGGPRELVSDSDLAGIIRPYYLHDLSDIPSSQVDSRYSVFITQENFNSDICGFWIGVGKDCSVIAPYGDALPNTTENENCAFRQFSGRGGLVPDVFIEANKLVTFTGAVNEWTLYGLGSAFHPLHVHVNHMQIISSASAFADGSDLYFRRGQWRDTIPPVADALTFRFIAADFEGETVLHCHFQRHEDLGMMDSFLVVNKSIYDKYFNGNAHKAGDADVGMWIGIGVGIAGLVFACGAGFFFLMSRKRVLPL